MKLLGIISVDFDAMYYLLTRYSAFVATGEKWEYSDPVNQ